MNDLPWEENRPDDEDEETTGATTDPLAEIPGSHGRKAPDPYEGTEEDDDPGPSLIDELEDHTPPTDAELGGGEQG
jgi:hypothetical protein